MWGILIWPAGGSHPRPVWVHRAFWGEQTHGAGIVNHRLFSDNFWWESHLWWIFLTTCHWCKPFCNDQGGLVHHWNDYYQQLGLRISYNWVKCERKTQSYATYCKWKHRKNPPEEDEVFLLEVEIFEVASPSALEFVHLEISIILVPTDIFWYFYLKRFNIYKSET